MNWNLRKILLVSQKLMDKAKVPPEVKVPVWVIAQGKVNTFWYW